VSYALLLLPLLIAAVLGAVVAVRRDRRGWAALAIAGATMLVLTLAFDSLMIAVDLFRYDDALLLGARIGVVPIEDLGYALVAVLVVVALWRVLPARGRAAERRGDA
jgi:lycopene cyclase domain-containing protein